MALQMAVAAKQYLKNSKWAHKQLQGSKKHHNFPHYLEDAAIPQVQVE
jgi:hypothetical protein